SLAQRDRQREAGKARPGNHDVRVASLIRHRRPASARDLSRARAWATSRVAFSWSMIFSESRYPLFGIMLWSHRMSSALDEILGILDLEPLEVNLFRGRSPQVPWQRVFGGQ